jgi:hypothetical protein
LSSARLRLRISEILPRLTDAIPRQWLVTLNRFPVLRTWARRGADTLTRRTVPAGVRSVVIPAGPLQGVRLVLDFDQNGERAIWLNTYEPWVQHTLTEVIRPGHLVFEAGAYIGTYALMIRRLAPGARVVALEPDPRNRRRLEETLDALARRYGTPDLVLMDIQGAEAAALEGSRDLLQAGSTTWLVELHGDEGAAAAAVLAGAGYRLETPDPRSDVDQLLRRTGRTHVLAQPPAGPPPPS